MPAHFVVCIDHKQARVFHLFAEGTSTWTITAPLPRTHHKHRRGPGGVRQHPNDAKQFFHQVSRAIDGADRVLVLGHASAKYDFLAYLRAHERALSTRITGIAAVDHPSDRQIIAHARDYFNVSAEMGEFQRTLD